jgi:hypothetical protein
VSGAIAENPLVDLMEEEDDQPQADDQVETVEDADACNDEEG